MKEKNLTPLRTYKYDKSEKPSLEELKQALTEIFKDTGYNVEYGSDTIWTEGLLKSNSQAIIVYNADHMKDYYNFVFYYTETRKSLDLQLRVGGKSKQVKHDTFAKSVKVFDGTAAKGLAKGLLIGGSVGAGYALGSVAGGAIGGSVRLIRKGVSALMRDKEAYQAEMDYYDTMIGISDALLAADAG